MKPAQNEPGLRLRVSEALSKDVGRAIVRIDPQDLTTLGVQVGDIVELRGSRRAVCKALPAHQDSRGQSRLQIEGITRENAGVGLDEHVEVRRVGAQPAERVVLQPTTVTPSERDLKYIGSLLDGLPVLEGNRVRAQLFGGRYAEFQIESTVPKAVVQITPLTQLIIAAPKKAETSRSPSYEDIGGLKRQLQRIREMIELPLRYPEIFERLGIAAPKGVLLCGSPGCGKTLIARCIAHETEASFFAINGPEIIHKFYGESEAHLRKIFDEAAHKQPSIIFLDEIDAIAPSRDRVTGDVEKRVVAQLLALMDGLNRRANVIVIAATNLPDSIDPALRRPGRFDREITIPVPDRLGRHEILTIHTRGMPQAQDVDMERLAEVTHGFVGADLEALCREAAMLCLRRIMKDIDFAGRSIPYEKLAHLEVNMSDFLSALAEIEPSALREVSVETPTTRWEEIGGLDGIKQSLIESVEWPLKHAELFVAAGVKPVKGILLSGPPGCGKTLLAKAAAAQCQVNFISVKGPSLLSKFVGDSERALREVFRKARQAAPCIIFFDEIDALVPARGSGGSDSNVTERVLGQFLAELDGIEELTGVLVLGATNRPDKMDPAMVRPGRFDLLLEVSPPDVEGRAAIFTVHLRGKPLAKSEPVDVRQLAAASQGMTGAEIAAICQHAALRALRRAIHASQPVQLETADLFAALAEIRERMPARSPAAPPLS